MGPDFLCIGAQKAGTSWLCHNLGQQAEVWVPPVKELHYLSDHPKDRLRSRLALSRPSYRRALFGGLRSATRPWSANDRKALVWALRFLAFPRSDRGYAALFPEFPDNPAMMRGELTPTYALLSEVAIARLAAMNRRARIVYLLRNPIDRAWSNVNMRVQKQRLIVDFSDCGPLERDLLGGSEKRAHADYLGNLERWGRYFPPDQIHVAFFDQLVEDPAALLTGVCRFLGIAAADIRIPRDVHRPRNARNPPPIPDSALRFLVPALAPYVAAQHRYFDNEYTARWMSSLAAHCDGIDR
jgi:hypothetical protein